MEAGWEAKEGLTFNHEDSCLQPSLMIPLGARQNLGRFIKHHLSIIADRKYRFRLLPNNRRNRRTILQRGDRVMLNRKEIEWADMLKLTAPASPNERARKQVTSSSTILDMPRS